MLDASPAIPHWSTRRNYKQYKIQLSYRFVQNRRQPQKVFLSLDFYYIIFIVYLYLSLYSWICRNSMPKNKSFRAFCCVKFSKLDMHCSTTIGENPLLKAVLPQQWSFGQHDIRSKRSICYIWSIKLIELVLKNSSA